MPVIGRFVPNQAGQVAARVAGAVDHFLVEVGDQVDQGDQIAILVSKTYIWERNRRNAEVSNAKARLATSRSKLQLLDQEMKRLQGLKNSPAFSPARLNDKQQENVSAKSEVSESQAMLMAAEAELQLGEIALANTVIRAPYAGVIIDRHFFKAGQMSNGVVIIIKNSDFHGLDISCVVGIIIIVMKHPVVPFLRKINLSAYRHPEFSRAHLLDIL